MAASQRGKIKAKASKARPGCPYIRLPWERQSLSISFDEKDGKTHQSFKDECDIDRIIEMHTRTGLVTHLNPGKPQYGDNPESTLFEAALAQAAIRSAVEDGWEPPADENVDSDREVESTKEAPSEASQVASEPTDVDSSDPSGL